MLPSWLCPLHIVLTMTTIGFVLILLALEAYRSVFSDSLMLLRAGEAHAICRRRFWVRDVVWVGTYPICGLLTWWAIKKHWFYPDTYIRVGVVPLAEPDIVFFLGGGATWRRDLSQGTPKTENYTDLSHHFLGRAEIHFRKNVRLVTGQESHRNCQKYDRRWYFYVEKCTF